MRELTQEEIENIHAQRKTARLSIAGLEQRSGLRAHRLSECMRGRVKMSENEIRMVFSNLATAQPIDADKGQRMLCTRCKDRLTEAGERICNKCLGAAQGVVMGSPVVEINGKRIPSQEEAEITRYAEKLAGMVTPVMEMVTTLRKDMDERFQREWNSLAEWREGVEGGLANLRDAIQQAVHKFSAAAAVTDPKLRPQELAARVEHVVDELGRKGKSIARLENNTQDLHERVTALALAISKSPVSATQEVLPEFGKLDLKAFANFEKICRQMRAKCPHLFAATVRRACGA